MSPRGTIHPDAAGAALVAASTPTQRPRDARLLAMDGTGSMSIVPRREWTSLVRSGDVVVANDAATLPASLVSHHLRTGARVEVRLAARRTLEPTDLVFDAVLFGEGDHRTRTEERAGPPSMRAGDLLALEGSPLVFTVIETLEHPRFVRISFEGAHGVFWSELARVGRPVQYAHVPEALALWDVWTVIAGPAVAFEPPSAGFVLDWAGLAAIRARGASFATLTHAAGLSSTGDPALDARLPLDEAYRIPLRTTRLVLDARARGGRVIAIGTTVVRALEHAASSLRDASTRRGALADVADQRIGRDSALRVVEVIVSGTHEPGTSHRELLRAFAPDALLAEVDARLAEERFRTHEFGDSVWIESGARLGSGSARDLGDASVTPRTA